MEDPVTYAAVFSISVVHSIFSSSLRNVHLASGLEGELMQVMRLPREVKADKYSWKASATFQEEDKKSGACCLQCVAVLLFSSGFLLY